MINYKERGAERASPSLQLIFVSVFDICICQHFTFVFVHNWCLYLSIFHGSPIPCLQSISQVHCCQRKSTSLQRLFCSKTLEVEKQQSGRVHCKCCWSRNTQLSSRIKLVWGNFLTWPAQHRFLRDILLRWDGELVGPVWVESILSCSDIFDICICP